MTGGQTWALPICWIEIDHLFANVTAGDFDETRISQAGGLEQKPEPCRNADLIAAILDSGIAFDDLETRLIDEAVKRADGNLAGAARTLGITRPQLQYRLKKKDGG
mgnify:CR=1 FL=1